MFNFLPKVRIQRKRWSYTKRTLAWTGLLTNSTRLFNGLMGGYAPDSAKERAQRELIEARVEIARLNAEVIRARAQKVSNDVVLGDLKIEETRHKLEARGILKSANFQEPSAAIPMPAPKQ